MKSSKWTLNRKAKKKCSNYTYLAEKRLETGTVENVPPPTLPSLGAAPFMENKETVWLSEGAEAVNSGYTSSSSDGDDSIVQGGNVFLTHPSKGPSIPSTSMAIESKNESISSSGEESALGAVRRCSEKKM